MPNFKIDLHTHSILSKDGGISKESYQMAIEEGALDFVAVTDHNEVDFAKKLKKGLGNKVIVGEEIMTQDGEIIGLFLKQKIEPGLSINQTLKEIDKQGGLVMIPHPFNLRRHSLDEKSLEKIIDKIDIFEVFNSRSIFRKSNQKALRYAQKNNLLKVVGSDAHSSGELGNTYTIVNDIPTKKNFKRLLQGAEHKRSYVSVFNLFSPTTNRIKKKIL